MSSASRGSNVVISAETDRKYQRVTGIWMFTNPLYSSNANLSFITPLKINNTELFPVDFDSALLFPVIHNDHFSQIDEEAGGSKLEVTLNDADNEDYYFTIVLRLENNVEDH